MGGPKLILLILLILTYPNLSHLSQWSKFPDVQVARSVRNRPGRRGATTSTGCDLWQPAVRAAPSHVMRPSVTELSGSASPLI